MQLKNRKVFRELVRALKLNVSIFEGIEEFFKRFTVLKKDHKKLRNLFKQRPVKRKLEQARQRSVGEKVYSSEEAKKTEKPNNCDHQASPANLTTHESGTDDTLTSSMDLVTSAPNGPSTKVLKNSDHQASPANFTTHVSDTTDESLASSMDPVTSTPNGLSAKVLDSALSPIEKV